MCEKSKDFTTIEKLIDWLWDLCSDIDVLEEQVRVFALKLESELDKHRATTTHTNSQKI